MAEWGGQGTRPHGLTLGAKFSLVGGRVGFYLPPVKRCRGRWSPGSAGPASRCRALQRELDCAARTARLGPGLPQVLARLQGAFPAPVLRNMGPRSSLLWGNFPSVGGPLAATLAPSCDNQKCPQTPSEPPLAENQPLTCSSISILELKVLASLHDTSRKRGCRVSAELNTVRPMSVKVRGP